ncbi:ABC transporter ATP-binding protein [bacterium]|nr:ABC transporter ATP-binding protein [bacterium]
MERKPLLQINNLSIHFNTFLGELKAVRGIDLTLRCNEILGLVGESGCGKSITSRAIMGLLKTPPASIPNGQILFEGEDLLQVQPNRLRQLRGHSISMIFQEPMTALNPVFRVGDQVAEVIETHENVSKTEIKKRVIDIFKSVGIPEPERRYREYPYQLSGGLRQRVMIAMALTYRPQLLIADEPTTALDVTIQAQILDLMLKIKEESSMSILMITHDLGVISDIADRVCVMYAGKIVEEALVDDLLDAPRHPYTQGLLACIPDIDKPKVANQRLHALEGNVPELYNIPAGCPFCDRCDQTFEKCRISEPPLLEVDKERKIACWLHCQ